MEKYDKINPKHYQRFSYEVIEMMVSIWGKEKVADYCEINAFKYLMRSGAKPDSDIVIDTMKSKWMLDKAEELRKKG